MHWKIWSTFYRTSSHQEDCHRCFHCFTDMRGNGWEQCQCRVLFPFLCLIVWEWFCCYHGPGLWPRKHPKKPSNIVVVECHYRSDISEEKNLVDVNDLPGVSRRQADVSQLYLRAAQKGDANAALRTAVEHLQRNESEKASLELWKLWWSELNIKVL